MFSYSCPKFQCLYIFKNLYVDCLRYKLSSPDKKPKQNSSKWKRHSQQQEAKSVRRRTAVSQRTIIIIIIIIIIIMIIIIIITVNNNNNNYNNDLEVAHPHSHSGSSFTWFPVELEFRNVGFWGEGKSGVPGEKPLGAKERTNHKLNPHMASTPGFEPGPNWWEASALTTATPLLSPRY